MTKQQYKRLVLWGGLGTALLILAFFLLFSGTTIGFFTFIPAIVYILVVQQAKRKIKKNAKLTQSQKGG